MTNEERDPIVEGYQDNGKQLSEKEIEKRTQAFSKRAKKAIATLQDPKKFDAKRRAAAATWLGEAGEPTAIIALIKAFESDPDKNVRRAAEESLGMLKTLGEILEDEDPEISGVGYDAVQDIVLYGAFGKRLNPKPAILTRIGVILSVVGALLLGIV